jgi:hypothetical protein
VNKEKKCPKSSVLKTNRQEHADHACRGTGDISEMGVLSCRMLLLLSIGNEKQAASMVQRVHHTVAPNLRNSKLNRFIVVRICQPVHAKT